MEPHTMGALLNKTPKNFLLEQKKTLQSNKCIEEKKQENFVSPTITQYKLAMADNNSINKLMKKYSIA